MGGWPCTALRAQYKNPPPLPYGKSWRVESKAQVRNCKSQVCRSLSPLKSPPTAPAHSARPYDFHFAWHSPSEMQKNYAGQDLIRICIKNASYNMHFCLHLCFTSLFVQHVSEMCSPPSVGSTFLKNGSKQSALKNVSFESLLGALALSIPLRRALFRH